MYRLNIIDEDGRKLVAFSSQPQREIDLITTHFSSKEELLKDLELDPLKFDLEIEKQHKETDKPVELPFFDRRYKDLYTISDKSYFQQELFSQASKLDREFLRNFFLNEIIARFSDFSIHTNETIRIDRFVKKENTSFDGATEENLHNALRIIEEELEKEKKYNSEDYDKLKADGDGKISHALSNYFINNYKKINYDNLKYFYRYVLSSGKIDLNISEDYEVKRDNEYKKLIKGVKKTVDKALSPDRSFFDDRKLEVINRTKEEELDFMSKNYGEEEIEEYMQDLDVFLDEKGMDEEQKRYYIKKNKKTFK